MVAVADRSGRLLYQKNIKSAFQQSEKLLPVIDSVLRRAAFKKNILSGIAVISGPGGFTSLRIGVAAANALAYAWGVPVAGVHLADVRTVDDFAGQAARLLQGHKPNRFVAPQYGQEPNITISRPPARPQ